MTDDIQMLYLGCSHCEQRFFYPYYQDLKLSEAHYRLTIKELENHKKKEHFFRNSKSE